MSEFLSPIQTLYTYFPLLFFFRVLVVCFLSAVTIYIAIKLYKAGKINKTQRNSIEFTFLYYYLILFFTVLGRRTKELEYPISFEVIRPFLEAFDSVNNQLLLELLINVLIFVPVGVGLMFVFKDVKCSFLTTGVTLLMSLSIELLQLLLRSGYFEIADIIKYLLGSMIGNGVYLLFDLYKKVNKQDI